MNTRITSIHIIEPLRERQLSYVLDAGNCAMYIEDGERTVSKLTFDKAELERHINILKAIHSLIK